MIRRRSQWRFDVVVIGGGHAGAEAAWAAAGAGASVALVTLDPARIGAMSCNPAIGGLAKGQMVREIDALGGLMALAADATGIQFRILNASRGPAVRGPRCQSDKYRYPREVQRLLACRAGIHILAASVEQLLVEDGRCTGIIAHPRPGKGPHPRPRKGAQEHPSGGAGVGCDAHEGSAGADPGHGMGPQVHPLTEPTRIEAAAVVVTTGTFMRGLMHTGDRRTPGGRIGEAPAVGISRCLHELGFELGRLKTGTPPRLDADTIDLRGLAVQGGDAEPVPFSDMTASPEAAAAADAGTDARAGAAYAAVAGRFPVVEQRPCHVTDTCGAAHELIRANLHRAPMYNGQIQQGSVGPRYCPSIEDKVVRFADRESHHVYLEPESLDTREVYCNGISTSLPADVQQQIVRLLPGCGRANILHYGYAVEYDMVWPHQIDATTMAKGIGGLFLAGQINGTSGYEEAAAQGLLAGLNAARFAAGRDPVALRRDQAYLGVLMDDLVTKTPREPYRMFTSRAEFRLLLRADNAAERLTPLARTWGLIDEPRWALHQRRSAQAEALTRLLHHTRHEGRRLVDLLRRPEVDADWLQQRLEHAGATPLPDRAVLERVLNDARYEGYIRRQQVEAERLSRQESQAIPAELDYDRIQGLRAEARDTLKRFRPTTFGQASRLSGVNPADLMLLTVALNP